MLNSLDGLSPDHCVDKEYTSKCLFIICFPAYSSTGYLVQGNNEPSSLSRNLEAKGGYLP